MENTEEKVAVDIKGQDRAEVLKTRALVLAVIVGNVAGNILLSRGLHRLGEKFNSSPWHYVHAIASPWVIGGILILAAWMISDLALLSRADLSFVLPVTSVSYVLIAIVGHWVLQERISVARWIGIVVIAVGATLVGETSPSTTPLHAPPEDEL